MTIYIYIYIFCYYSNYKSKKLECQEEIYIKKFIKINEQEEL